jgi:DNA (cytosine-5)-methyltransferase 1
MATMSASTRESMIFYAFNENGKNIGYRQPTIREIASFMSFPITYQFEAKSEVSKYRIVGNAVCPKLSKALAKAIKQEESKHG